MLLIYVLLVFGCLSYGSADRLNFPGCDRAGWKCYKIPPNKYEVEYTCPATQTIVDILTWNFRIGTDVIKLRIQNCTNLIVDLSCTNEGRQLIQLELRNIKTLNFTNVLHKDLIQTFESMIFENISMIHNIPEKTFKQMTPIPASSYRCANMFTRLNRIIFRNVVIDKISQNSFWKLSGMEEFVWHNVTVNTIENSAMKVDMNYGKTFNITDSRIGYLEYKAMDIRASKIHLHSNSFGELLCNSIHVVTDDFNFANNTVEFLHANSMSILAENVNLLNNSFQYMRTRALEAIGPGLLQDSHKSFGHLLFTYRFINNFIKTMDVGSLNPDYTAYKNVKNIIEIRSNKLVCSCSESGWLAIRNGLGHKQEDMMIFNEQFLDRDNGNLCFNAPCPLPVESIRALSITDNMCNLKISLTDLCRSYSADKTVFSKLDPVNINGKMSFYEKPGYVPIYIKHDQTTEQFPVVDVVSKSNRSQATLAVENPIEQILQIARQTGTTNSMNIPVTTDFKIIGSNLNTKDNNTNVQSIIEKPAYNDKVKFEYLIDNFTESSDNSTKFPQMDVRFNPNNLNSTLSSLYTPDEQKNLLKKSYENWQNYQKRKLVLFKIYGSYLTLE